MPDDATQRLVADRYQLERRLGTGGMGEVWAARDTVLGRLVAVKAVDLTRTRPPGRDELRARVLREGRAAARIDHPGCVTVYDVVEEDDRVHLVMELVEAPTLTDEVLTHGPLEPRRAARMGLELVDALAAAHRAGIVHRDVKPHNVLVLADGQVKLADFGIASVRDDPNLTSTGMMLGTPTYMSPEAARGERAGAPADLWGLGALLYYAVEGAPAFDRGEALPTLNAVLHDEPRPMGRAGALEPVIRALLVKSPDTRPDVEETRRLLEDVVGGGSPTVAIPADATAVLAATPAPEVVERYEHRPAPTGRRRPPPPGPPPADRRWLGALIAVALVAALTGIGLALTQGDDDPTDAAVSSTVAPNVESTTTAPTTSTTEATTTTTAAPEGGEVYEGPNFRIELPDGWKAVGAGGADGVRFEGPGGALLVDSVRPPADDPVEAWEDQEEAFRADHPSYERIRLEETGYRDYEAAIWEYTYEGMHADNLGFVVDDTGYALNFVTEQSRWDESAELREGFRSSFEPA